MKSIQNYYQKVRNQKPAFYASVSIIEKGWDTSMRFDDEYGEKIFYEIELALVNRDNQVQNSICN